MNLEFNLSLAKTYKSKSQIARILSEDWLLNNAYCPSCGNNNLNRYRNNNPAADFNCFTCGSDFELKSTSGSATGNIVDGAYETLMNKILTFTNPNFFFLNYTPDYSVRNFFIIPKHFFVPDIIEKRKPLQSSARRAGWVGCNILAKNLPSWGRIFVIKNEVVVARQKVMGQWKKTAFLDNKEMSHRGWLLELMSIIDSIPNKIFTLSEVYSFEGLMQEKFPNNRFVREKIRQQLQVLRDKGFIKFIKKGIYQKND